MQHDQCEYNSMETFSEETTAKPNHNIAFWKPFSLIFHDAIHERQFQRVSARTWRVQDFLVYYFICLASLLLSFRVQTIDSQWFMTFFVIQLTVSAALFGFSIRYDE